VSNRQPGEKTWQHQGKQIECGLEGDCVSDTLQGGRLQNSLGLQVFGRLSHRGFKNVSASSSKGFSLLHVNILSDFDGILLFPDIIEVVQIWVDKSA
ncbi:hypothetical protein PENTCL1PPCAC_29050, partial [Pristionchus entomophagus]